MHSSNSLVKEAQGYSNTKAIYMCHRGFKNGGGGGGFRSSLSGKDRGVLEVKLTKIC